MLIYGATVIVWLTGVIAPLIEVLRTVYTEHPGWPPLPSELDVRETIVLLAFALATVLTIIVGYWAGVKRERDSEALRRLAVEAMQHALQRRLDAQSAAGDAVFLDLCIKLAGKTPTAKSRERIHRRAKFYIEPANAERYLSQQSERQFSAHLIACLCDLPPRWILDCESGRRA